MSTVPYYNKFLSPSHYENDIKSLMKEIRPDWKDYNIKVFTAGISNQLLGCYCSNSPDNIILFRIYGSGTEAFIDRDNEKLTIQLLHEKNMGTPLLATFENGIVYEYIPGDILTTDSVKDPHIWPLVAEKVGLLHRVLPVNTNEKIVVWDKMEKFINLLPNDFSSIKSIQICFTDKKALTEEYLSLKNQLLNNPSRIVFCHNDLLLANIILSKDQKSVNFIDFEYAGANFAAYEIANHFNEFAGVEEVDYSLLPSDQFQKTWIAHYLKNFFETSQVSDEEVEKVFRQVKLFLPFNHFFWGCWGLVQAINSKIEFDFVSYALIRFRQYIKTKINVN